MKSLYLFIKKITILILTGLILLFLNNCQGLSDDEMILEDSAFNHEQIPWKDLLQQLDSESEIAFVQNGESIQEAIDGALPGDIVYIEPGNYLENLSINNSDIKLIGLSMAPNDLIFNNGQENHIDILKLYDQKSVNNFQYKSQNKGKSRISDFSRTEMGRGIVHYQFKLRVGSGDFDVIRIHRVVRESRPYRAIPTKGHVFMVHGALTGFGGTFLSNGLETSDDINAATSSPFYLASKNIDVWGIDMGWTMVPNSTTEFSFMDGWGYEKDARHALKAMKIARLLRGFSGQGFSALNVLGFSSGNTVAYAAANKETQQSNMRKRHIKGIITVDNAFKNEDGDSGCASAQAVADAISGGTYENTNGQFFQTLGFLALNYPDDISPILGEPTTNIQAFRLIFAEDIFGFGMHFLGGDFNGLFYSDEMRAVRAISSFNHFMPNLLWQEIDQVNCASMGGVIFDNYLNLISVPIFYIGAGGGAGETGYYTASQTASTDITNHVVSLASDRADDFGHIDNFIGSNADQHVWSELRDWITNHR